MSNIKRLTESDLEKIIKKVIQEQSIKYGMKDSAGSTKIKNLQQKLDLKSASGKKMTTGYFGNLTASALLQKVPRLYKNKETVIDDRLYQQIMSSLPEPPRNQERRQQGQDVTVTNTKVGLNFNALWNNFPKGAAADQIFPGIFPELYKDMPESFKNACATRLSLALNNLGVKPIAQYKTMSDWSYQGVNYKKGLPITVRAKDTPNYLNSVFGPPSFKGPNTPENVDKYIKGKNAIFVITNVPRWSATGHVDVVNSKMQCGHACYLGEVGGILQAWYV